MSATLVAGPYHRPPLPSPWSSYPYRDHGKSSPPHPLHTLPVSPSAEPAHHHTLAAFFGLAVAAGLIMGGASGFLKYLSVASTPTPLSLPSDIYPPDQAIYRWVGFHRVIPRFVSASGTLATNVF